MSEEKPAEQILDAVTDLLSEADILSACESSIDFWLNDTDNEEWNNSK
ncbi:MAG: hypothetical protein BWX97_01964 [Firmicutes bacterium ADurb.Bin146]|jgi:hypothetical protein|nr:MAG: hypothetical protein BWX97_01964 [Firmicutes bacterium ADurb.Bin146]